MPKHKDDNKQAQPTPMQPKVVSKQDLATAGIDVNIPTGKILIVQVDSEGKELDGKGFLTNADMWEKVYKHKVDGNGKPVFQVKKKQETL